ncbi:UDP-3-O-(3-hydroxymyristoyl)glucosamine N-acyltransferase [Polyangium sp. 15x6]|uniref:UDP-3-O-(3-hydroxymyristoyl)glucosamine N-acyltransferase n=1 Tax=Polyangium sp. 15x6 TaxID=3042687 RepID=UPI00249B38A6|nr:UDP-3-O-(3-hydroxymyristoyl)glucosamine N-acyltransferase [Polyangium sp. 15x6]MDI3283428.1 UDP-3-O-(3-hydroxymyristoyl)glucosamine N-acyltransferase [Polyangium sp. 15x6]
MLPAPVPLRELAAKHGGMLDPGLEDAVVSRVAPVDVETSEGATTLAPLLSRRYLEAARASATFLLVDGPLASLVPAGKRWIHPRAAYALACVLEQVPRPEPVDARALARIDPLAIVDPTAIIGPFAVVYAGAEIGPHCRIEPHVVVYGGVSLGARVTVGASSVLGRPGFGWAASPTGGVVRMPQLGGVVVEDDVEIGPLCTVDAGTLAPTVIGRGAKLDAHVHVGHNASIGEGTLVAAQAGFAGSSRIGAGVLVGGQVGVADHCEVGAGARLAAKAGVIGDVPAGAVFGGYPAVEKARWLRATARILEEPGRKRKGRSG